MRMYLSSGNVVMLFDSIGNKAIPIRITRKWLRNCFDDDSSDYGQMTYKHIIHDQEENLDDHEMLHLSLTSANGKS